MPFYAASGPAGDMHNAPFRTAHLAARTCALLPCDGSSSPSLLVSAAVLVSERGCPSRCSTASFVRRDVLCASEGPAPYTLSREMMTGGHGVVSADTWLPTATIEAWARRTIDGDAWCSEGSLRWSRSSSSMPCDTRHPGGPTLLFHQSPLCFCWGATRWRSMAASRPARFTELCKSASTLPWHVPSTDIVLVDFDDDLFSLSTLFNGRQYGTVSQFARACGLNDTTPYKGGASNCCYGTLLEAFPCESDEDTTAWSLVTSPMDLAQHVSATVDDLTNALSRMERAALCDASTMKYLVQRFTDENTLAAYAYCPTPGARQAIRTPLLREFTETVFSTHPGLEEDIRGGGCDSSADEWIRE